MRPRGPCPAPSWRPSCPGLSSRRGSRHPQLLAPEDVQVRVKDLLTGVGPVVYPDGVAALLQPELPRHQAGDLEEAPRDRLGQARDLLQGRDVLLGDDEHVHRRPSVYVVKGQHLILVVHHLGVQLPANYLTENAVGLAHPLNSSPGRSCSPTPLPCGPRLLSRRSRSATGTDPAARGRAPLPRPAAAPARSTRPRDPRRGS